MTYALNYKQRYPVLYFLRLKLLNFNYKTLFSKLKPINYLWLFKYNIELNKFVYYIILYFLVFKYLTDNNRTQ